jgi:fatty-acid desaturase
MSSPARELQMFFASNSDARRLTRNSHLCVALIYGNLLAAAFGLVPAWTLAIVVMLLVPRWMIAVHELFHLRSEREVDPLTRLQVLLFTPLSLGYRENLANHRSHHRYMGTPSDAEFYQLRGSRLTGFANAMSAPEQMWFRWVSEHGIDRRLALDTAARCALFAGFVVITGPTFLWYWLPARVAVGTSYFVFFYWLHRQGDAMGVYPLLVPARLASFLTTLYGPDVVEATLHHDAHHAQPRIAAEHLARSRERLKLSH